MTFKEYTPAGYSSWFEYNKDTIRKNARICKIKDSLWGMVLVIALLAAYVADANLEAML